jgi:hypothetical protein
MLVRRGNPTSLQKSGGSTASLSFLPSAKDNVQILSMLLEVVSRLGSHLITRDIFQDPGNGKAAGNLILLVNPKSRTESVLCKLVM